MIYLDNAATTFPKPPCLTREIARCIHEYCGNPGRSGHILSLKASEKIFECREKLAAFFGLSHPENVVFTLNTTYAINIAIHALYEPGTHVLISNMEHNSVLRPVEDLQKKKEISYSIFDVLQPTELILQELKRRLRPNTKMLIMQHASNVCGKAFPIHTIGDFCKKHGIIFIVDAAQSAGTLPIHIEKDHIDALCVPAHKGLYGPQGLGFVIFGERPPLRNFITGGNGINSLSAEMGLDLPESFEGGTMPTPLIAGLCASLHWLQDIGTNAIREKETKLAAALFERLQSLHGSILYGGDPPETGILLYRNSKKTINELSSALNAQNICTRSGFHCSPLAHKALHTGNDGALRISLGYFNTTRDIDAAYHAIRDICK